MKRRNLIGCLVVVVLQLAVSCASLASREDVQRGTIALFARGDFVGSDGERLSRRNGSGFIIDASGIAVTNNHVVTGATDLSAYVYIDGEYERRRARVLGASECSDLAVVDIEGEGYSYLDWYEDEVPLSIRVYAARVLKDSSDHLKLAVTSGTVTDARSKGLRAVLSVQHTAALSNGNSGGPLVDRNGKVLGVNYGHAGIVDKNYRGFASSVEEVREIVERMKTGENVDSLGLNERILSNKEDARAGNRGGMLVTTVAPGSPADQAGIQAGDFVIELDGVAVGRGVAVRRDSAMVGYCETLRNHEPGDVLSLVVVRPETGEHLEGEINGRKLEVVSGLEGS